MESFYIMTSIGVVGKPSAGKSTFFTSVADSCAKMVGRIESGAFLHMQIYICVCVCVCLVGER